MYEPINLYFKYIDTFNAPEHIDPYVRKTLDDMASQLCDFQSAFQKVEQNFRNLDSSVASLEGKMFDSDEKFERFIRSHFTPRTIAYRVVERVGPNPTHSRLLLNFRWLLDEIDSFRTGMFVPNNGTVANTSTILDALYAEFPELLETTEDKLEFFFVVVSDSRNCEVLDLNDNDLFSDNLECCAFKKDFHEQIEADPERLVKHIFTMDNPHFVADNIYNMLSDTDTCLKIIDAVIDHPESEHRHTVLKNMLSSVVGNIRNSKNEDSERKFCEYADRVFRQPDAFEIFMDFNMQVREAIREKCPSLNNYLKVKFPHG